MTTPEIVGLVALGLNASAIVWGAASMAAAVKNLEGVVKEVKEIVYNLTSNILPEIKARISVLEDRNKRNDNETVR